MKEHNEDNKRGLNNTGFSLFKSVSRGLLFCAVALPMLVGSSCKKDDSSDPVPDDDPKDPAVQIKHKHDIYLAVSYDSIYVGGVRSRSYAGYYHNGQIHKLEGQSTNVDCYANAIFVDGNDVYVCGREGDLAVYWKNDEIVYLPGGVHATSICVKNGNVYVSGYEVPDIYSADKACCWINNNKTSLDMGTRATCITADAQGHVYIGGYYLDRTTYLSSARFWTDAESNNIERNSLNSQYSSEVWAIALDETHQTNGHAYICMGGHESTPQAHNINKQWVNRKATDLCVANGNMVNGIVAYNGKLYTCGNDMKIAKYWSTTIAKNGEGQDLMTMQLSDGRSQCYATGIDVEEGDVYVVGYEPNNQMDQKATVWKNGTKFLSIPAGVRVTPNGIDVVSTTELVTAE